MKGCCVWASMCLSSACGGAPPAPESAPAPRPSVAVPRAASARSGGEPKGVEPPPPARTVALKVYDEFVAIRLPPLPQRHLTDAELIRLLPPALRVRVTRALRAEAALTKLSRKAYDHEAAVFECEERSCPKLGALEAQLKHARDAASRRYDFLEKERSQLQLALETALKRRPTVGAALAMARVEELAERLSNVATYNNPAATRLRFGWLSKDNALPSSPLAIAAYRRAALLAAGKPRLQSWAHYGAATHLFAAAKLDGALKELEAAAKSPPRDLAQEIQLRMAVLHSAAGDHESALKSLQLAQQAAGSLLSRSDFLALEMLEQFRAGEHAKALRAAVLSLRAPPTHGASWSAAPSITLNGRERIAVDCLEQLGDGALKKSGATAEIQSLLLGQLARRHYYRDDLPRARGAAEAAIRVAPKAGEARVAYKVLAALARKAGDAAQTKIWKGKEQALRPAKSASARAGLLGLLGSPSPEGREKKYLDGSIKKAGSTEERRVASLTRLCLEPSSADLEDSDALRSVTLRVRVSKEGRAESISDERGVLADFSECMYQQVPRVFRGETRDVQATLDLRHASQSRMAAQFSAAFKAGDGPGFGAMGLGRLKGGSLGVGGSRGLGSRGSGAGGGGTGVGIGGLGTRGLGGGRGFGSGQGRFGAGGRKKPPATRPKKPKKRVP